MTIPELFGFLITLFILGFMFLKQVWEARERRANPEEYKRKQLEKEKQLKNFMKSLNIDIDEDEAEEERRIKASKKLKQAQHQAQKQGQKRSSNVTQNQSQQYRSSSSTTNFSPAPVTRQSMNAVNSQVRTKNTVYTATQAQESVASKLVQDQRSMRDAIILCEIIGPPKGRS